MPMDIYTPPSDILEKYARVLVDFALGNKKGIQPGEVVYIQFDAEALPLAHETYRHVLKRGGFPMVKMTDEGFSKILMEEGNDDQLTFFPKEYMRSLVDTIDHRMYLIAPRDPFFLKSADPEKVMLAAKGFGTLKTWLRQKQDEGNLTWTLCLYGTAGLAKEAGISLEKFWDQIIRACFLEDDDPVQTWQRVDAEISSVRNELSKLPIDTLNVRSKNTDLNIKLGENRKWLAGGGNNIPSFEIFTSPDWRGTEGTIYFDYPLYRYGNIIKDIQLEFKKGIVVKARAAKNEKLIQELVKQENADKVGEYSLTDTRFSKINTFMANTLYDENYGGEWGNTHVAVGSSFHDAYTGDIQAMSEEDWADLGFNESREHTDIMATNDRTVEATMKNGSKKVIYAKGHFTL